jgi:tetratricopeptide (TPR) repeat protein
MKFAKSSCWIFSGLLLVAGSAQAQDAATQQVSRQGVKAQASDPAAIEAREKPLRDAEALMKAGNPAAAYNLLDPLEFERSGEIRFDYLLGIAALDSGKPDKATLAFERVMAVNPDFAGARLDMARAYYQLGDLSRAKTEFNTVLKQNPPEMARATIQKYLNEIAAYERAKQTHLTGYVEGVYGYDNNVANSSSQTFTFASNSPWSGLFPANQLTPSEKLQEFYGGLNAGLEVAHSLNANWSIYAGADLRQHSNATQTLYNSTSTAARLGVMYATEQNAYKLTLSQGELYLASTERVDSPGVSAEWQHVFSPANQMSTFAQYGKNRASGVQPTSPTTDARIEGNLDQVILGASWVHAFADGKKVLFGSVYAGNELDVAPVISAGLPNGGRTDGKRHFEGMRIGGQFITSEKLDWTASLGLQTSLYLGQQLSGQPVGVFGNPLIMAQRREKLYDLTIAANYHIRKLWTAKPQISYSKKDSNLALYSFDRTDLSLTIRRDFK